MQPSRMIQEFLDVCIKERRCVADNDLSGIADCISIFREMNNKEFDPKMCKVSQVSAPSAFEGHLLFTADYLEALLTDKMDDESVEEDEHSMRARPEGDLLYVHCLIPARGTTTLQYEGEGFMELIVICEHEQLLGVKIDVNEHDFHYRCPNKTPDGIRYHQWTMQGEGLVKVSITNPTNRPVSVVLASN